MSVYNNERAVNAFCPGVRYGFIAPSFEAVGLVGVVIRQSIVVDDPTSVKLEELVVLATTTTITTTTTTSVALVGLKLI
jgi:hypothetical protein